MATKRLDLFVRPNTLTKQEVIDKYLPVIEKFDKAKEDENLAHYIDATDLATGDKYMLFGKKALKALKIDGAVQDILDKTSLLETISALEDKIKVLESNKSNYVICNTIKG